VISILMILNRQERQEIKPPRTPREVVRRPTAVKTKSQNIYRACRVRQPTAVMGHPIDFFIFFQSLIPSLGTQVLWKVCLRGQRPRNDFILASLALLALLAVQTKILLAPLAVYYCFGSLSTHKHANGYA